MSSNSSVTPELSQPRARRPGATPENGSNKHSLQPNGNRYGHGHPLAEMETISRQSTPVPVDAPSSVHAISSARKQIRAQQKERMFPTIEYEPRVSHFDPQSEHRDFRGFFVLFWIGLAIMAITTGLRNLKETGYPFPFRQRNLFLENIWELGFIDLAMVSSTMLNLALHKLYSKGPAFLRWKRGGIWVQSAFQVVWLLYWVKYIFPHPQLLTATKTIAKIKRSWPFFRDWTWTAQVFFTLHLLALFMKVHSWSFYNGHLSDVKSQLDALDAPEKLPKKRRPLVRYPSSSMQLQQFKEETISIAQAANTGDGPVKIEKVREDLAVELTSPLGNVTYPQNLTLSNYVDFLFCPTLCYELEYPRIEVFRPLELFFKTLAVFGCIFLLTVTSESFIMPVLDEAAIRLHACNGLLDAGLIFAETISRLLFPFMVTFLLVFLVIFEYILGAFAEITCFADRHFYADWWNSCDWLEFSREWNIPVHNFFRRHVYTASRNVVSKPIATFVTFLISALAHELVMGCITKKLRGYGFVAMMLQMPIVLVQRSKWVRGRTLLNNILFWCSMILGLSMMCALYVLL